MKDLLARLEAAAIPRPTDVHATAWRVPDRLAYVVNHAFPFSTNGYAVRTHGVATALAGQGHSVVAITRPGRPWDLPGFNDPGFALHHDIDGVRYLHLRRPSSQGLAQQPYLEAATEALREALRVFKPSAVMAASNWENALPAAIAARELGLPFFYEVRGFWEVTRASQEPGWGDSDEFAHCVRMETAVARAAQRVFTLNEPMRQELVRRGVPSQRIALVPNAQPGVTPSALPGAEAKLRAGCKARHLVGYVGSFSEYEGLDDLVRAVAQLRRDKLDVALMLVGSSHPLGADSGEGLCATGQRLRALAQESGLGEHLILTGRRPARDLPDLYAALDLVAIPRKPLPVAELVPPVKPFEAAAHGKPVLLSDVGALHELRHALPGCDYFRAGDTVDLAEHIQQRLRDAAGTAELVARNSQAVQQATWTQSTAELSALLREAGATRAAVAIAPAAAVTAAARPAQEVMLAGGGDAAELAQLADAPLWFELPLSDVDYLEVHGQVRYLNISEGQRRKGVLLVEFLDAEGRVLAGPYKDFTKSDALGWFRYLAPPADATEPLATLQPCAGAVRVRVGLRSFYCSGKEQVRVSRRLALRWHDNRGGAGSAAPAAGAPRVHPQLPCLPFEMPPARGARALTVASVLDPFSHACFAPEAELVSITPAGWRQQLLDRKIDFLLVESAWHGNGDAWLYRVASFAKPPGNELGDVVRWARRYGIPTVFWNKEDPPNFDRFIDRASDFDFIFTTDENCIERYRRRVGPGTRVAALPFAAQPRIHNPLLQEPRVSATSFAGTYYADDFEPRRRAMDLLLRLSARHGLDIFDRMFSVTGKEKERFTFPKDLQPYIRGSLAYDQMLQAYRHYRVGLNVNSVSDSPTMFSRRVFELLACGTPVVSTESLGIDRIFKGLVPTVEGEAEAAEVLQQLMTDAPAWLRASVRGLRAVFAGHTYAHRMSEIAQAVGLSDFRVARADALVAVHPDGDAQRFAAQMAAQSLRPLEVLVGGSAERDEAVRRHVQALQAAGLPARALPVGNIASYARQRHARSVVAVCASAHHYGPAYLEDARISLEGTPGLDASTMEAGDDVLAFLARLPFEQAARIGLSTARACAGTVVAAAHSPVLPEALARAGHAGDFELRGRQLRTRARFEFVARVEASGLPDATLINLC